MGVKEEIKYGFEQWYRFGLDDDLKDNIADLIKFYYESDNNIAILDGKSQKDKIIEGVSDLLYKDVGLDKNIIKRYLKYHLEMYNSIDLNYYLQWYQDNYKALQNQPDWKYEVLFKDFYPEIYKQTLNQLNVIKALYKTPDEKMQKLKDRLDSVIIKFKSEVPDVFKHDSKIYYDINNNIIIFELPIYFIKDQYDKYKKLNLKDMTEYVNKTVNIVKIIHEISHTLQQEALKKKARGEEVLDENGNPISLDGDYWQDLSERMADRNVARYIKRQLGIKDWNETIQMYQNEYYNYLVKNKLNINFNNRDDEQQKKRIVNFLYGVMPWINEIDIDRADFSQLIKWVKEYSEKSFKNSEWYRYAERHWGMAALRDKDIPKGVIGKMARGLYKIADTMEEFGSYDVATDIDDMISRMFIKEGNL